MSINFLYQYLFSLRLRLQNSFSFQYQCCSEIFCHFLIYTCYSDGINPLLCCSEQSLKLSAQIPFSYFPPMSSSHSEVSKTIYSSCTICFFYDQASLLVKDHSSFIVGQVNLMHQIYSKLGYCQICAMVKTTVPCQSKYLSIQQ